MVFVSENEKTGILSHLWMFSWFLSVRMKKQELSHIYVWFMVFVSENGKTGTFSLSWIIESLIKLFPGKVN